MSVKIFGVTIEISYIFCCLITLFVAIDRTGLLIPLIVSMLLHQFAHVSVLLLFGCKLKKIRLLPGLIGVDYKCIPDKSATVISLLSGPISNFIAAYVCFLSDYNTLFGINLILGIVNILPCSGLDGGAVIETTLCGILSNKHINIVMLILTVLTVMMLILFNIIYLEMNYSVIIFCLYLISPIILKILLKERRN